MSLDPQIIINDILENLYNFYPKKFLKLRENELKDDKLLFSFKSNNKNLDMFFLLSRKKEKINVRAYDKNYGHISSWSYELSKTNIDEILLFLKRYVDIITILKLNLILEKELLNNAYNNN